MEMSVVGRSGPCCADLIENEGDFWWCDEEKGEEPTKFYTSTDKANEMIKMNALFLLFLCFTNLGPLSMR